MPGLETKETNPNEHIHQINFPEGVTKFIYEEDVNGAIALLDTAREKDAESAIWQVLAEHYKDNWDGAGETTFREFLEKKYKSKKLEPSQYREFKIHLEEKNHRLLEDTLKYYHQIQNQLKEGIVFPSFILAMQQLNEKFNDKFQLRLRTY